MRPISRVFAILFAALLAGALVSCGGSSASNSSEASSSASAAATAATQVQAKGSPWIDANVIDVVTAETPTDVHNDFYIAQAKDWLSSVKIPSYADRWSVFDAVGAQHEQQLLDLIEKSNVTDHDVEVLRNYYDLLMDWDVREQAGIAPIMPMLEAVWDIQTIDELTAYLESDAVRQRGNYLVGYDNEPSGETLLTLSTSIMGKDAGYKVTIGMNSRFTVDVSDVEGANDMSAVVNAPFVQKATYMLRRAGYSSGEAVALVSLVAPLEARLAASAKMTEDEEESFWSRAFEIAGTDNPDEITAEQWNEILELVGDTLGHAKEMTRDEIQKMAGAFPILGLLDAYGFDDAQGYIVSETGWLAEMGAVYNQDNLEALKAHIICGILLDNMSLLDYEALEVAENAADLEDTMNEAVNELESGTDEGDAAEIDGEIDEYDDGEYEDYIGDVVPEARVATVSEDELKRMAVFRTLKEDMPAAMTNAFIAHCYSPEAQARAEELTSKIIDKYHTLLNMQDWMDDATKKRAIEKLDGMSICVGYPKDGLPDTSGLVVPSMDEGGTLVDVSLALSAYNVQLVQEQLHGGDTDMLWADALTVNAFNDLTTNSVVICGGIIGGELFSAEWPIEKQLAVLGTTIGHEISHAFDDSGAAFDKDGNLNNWWTAGDLADFEARTAKVVNYLQTIDPLGAGSYDGSAVCGEVIADMAGLKVVLLVAADIDGFDYEKFFEYYAIGWESVGTYDAELTLFYADSHPLDATRMNVSVMQAQEFYDTYGIKPGDAMYLAPEDRISIW